MAPTPMETRMNLVALDTQLADGGIDANPVDLLLLAHAARDLGVADVLIDVMVDDHEPSVARIRAYAKVSSAVALAPAATPAGAGDRVLQVA